MTVDLDHLRRCSALCRRALACAGLVLATLVTGEPARAQGTVAQVAALEGPMFTTEDLDSLVAPIALYPDPLLSLVLAASTEPLQVVHAHRYLEAHKADPGLRPSPTWHTAIIGLLNYPTVLVMMNDDLEWTEQLGLAFIYQEQDLMDAVQYFRAQVYAAGNLVSDEHIVVVREREIIKILPVRTEVIYVPVYDPRVVVIHRYVRRPPLIVYHYYPAYYSPTAVFFTGLFIGFAIHYGFDWHDHHYHVYGWHEHWGYRDIDIYVQQDIHIGDITVKRSRIIVNRARRDLGRDRHKAVALSNQRRLREGRPTRLQEGLERPERVRPPQAGTAPAPVQRRQVPTAREAETLRRAAPREAQRPGAAPRRTAPQPLNDYGRGTQTTRERERGATSRERAAPPSPRPSYQRERQPTVTGPPARRAPTPPAVSAPTRRAPLPPAVSVPTRRAPAPPAVSAPTPRAPTPPAVSAPTRRVPAPRVTSPPIRRDRAPPLVRPPARSETRTPSVAPPARRESPAPSITPPARRDPQPPAAEPPSRRERPRSQLERRSEADALNAHGNGAASEQVGQRGKDSLGRIANRNQPREQFVPAEDKGLNGRNLRVPGGQ